MSIRIALAGNPNCGKTTLFNDLTGSSQYVGNWPGVTVEKKEGRLKGRKDVVITDLPGIYSLSPYSPEEVVSRDYLTGSRTGAGSDRPEAVIDLVDGTNLERNLYLTTQLVELGIPMVVALNMSDLVEKSGDKIDQEKLSRELGCPVVPISALKGTGTKEAVKTAIQQAQAHVITTPQHTFSKPVEEALATITSLISGMVPQEQSRWFAVKLFERDGQIPGRLSLSEQLKSRIDAAVTAVEKQLEDDSESIITNERYEYIAGVIGRCMRKKTRAMTTSDKIDRVVTNRWLALPIFVAVMFLVYFVSVTTVGTWATDWANDGVFGDGWHLLGIGSAEYETAVEEYEAAVEAAEAGGTEYTGEEPDPAAYGVWVPGIPVLVGNWLESMQTADWLQGLILDGIIGGVGAVLGFVPQMFVLFFFLSVLEDCGYMARIAFIMDRIFRKFGLSGKSFIPMLISSGCGVPGIMATKAIENDKDRRMTIMTTTFIPCGAKLPVIALIAGAIMGGAWWMAPAMYFVGILAVVLSGIILKKTRMFAGDPAPFVMELPQYHVPAAKSVLIHMWERCRAFIVKAGTVIFVACGLIWFLSSFGWVNGSFGMVAEEESMLAAIGNFISPIFSPLGFDNWKASVATFSGLVAKENVVGTFGVLNGMAAAGEDDPGLWAATIAMFPSAVAAVSFLIFNLLCAPCFAAIGAIKREMASAKWTAFSLAYQTLFAYAIALMVYQFGTLFTGGAFGVGTAVAIVVLAAFLYLLFRPARREKPVLRTAGANA